MKPKLEALRIAEVKLQDAQKELEAAESKLQDCQDVLTKLQSKFEAQMAKKRAIEDNAARTRSRMEQVGDFDLLTSLCLLPFLQQRCVACVVCVDAWCFVLGAWGPFRNSSNGCSSTQDCLLVRVVALREDTKFKREGL